ncbi:MAG: hypothetical protein WC528_02020 [Patescibacteria group bacterium]
MEIWSKIQPSLTRRILLPVFTALSGSSYLSYLKRTREDQWLKREKIQQKQIKNIKDLLVHAYETTAYYRQVFDYNDFSPYNFHDYRELKKIPILNKDIIRQRFKDLISRKYPINKLKKMATGGSTGQPLNFYTTPERELRHASTTALNLEWAGLRLGDRLAMLWGAPFDISKSKSIKGRVENILLGRLLLPTFILSDEIFARYHKLIIRFRPKSLLGYTSCLIEFAKYIQANNLIVPGLCSVISGAETLYPWQRELLEKVFKCTVFDRYGGRDSGAIAAECPENHSLHLNENLLYAENTVDGNILITDLWNYGMPFIRYNTEDLGEIGNQICACGRQSRLMLNLKGRVHDMLLTPDGRKVPGEFFPHLFKDVGSVKKFQVVQYSRDKLYIRIVKDKNIFNDRDIEYLKTHISDYFGNVSLNFEYVDEIPKSSSGKHRFTILNIK